MTTTLKSILIAALWLVTKISEMTELLAAQQRVFGGNAPLKAAAAQPAT